MYCNTLVCIAEKKAQLYCRIISQEAWLQGDCIAIQWIVLRLWSKGRAGTVLQYSHRATTRCWAGALGARGSQQARGARTWQADRGGVHARQASGSWAQAQAGGSGARGSRDVRGKA